MRRFSIKYALLYVFAAGVAVTPSEVVSQDLDDAEKKDGIVINAEAVVERAVEQCRRERTEPETVSPADLCELRSWGIIGGEYPSLADKALRLQRQTNSLAGEKNECTSQLRDEREQADRLSRHIGRLEGEVERRWTPLKSVIVTAIGTAVGFTAGYIVGAVTR